MDVHVRGGPAAPFLSAADLFATEYEIDGDVTVRVREDPDERTRVSHDEESHCLTISRQAATSAMARELTLHEFAHMHRYEEAHPSHTQSTREAIYLALAGQSVERRTLSHCYQIANHMKDIYADDVWLDVVPSDKLVAFLESSLAAAVADTPRDRGAWDRLTPATDPDINAVNAAFALALVERHALVDPDHPIYDLAHAAAEDAPHVSFEGFKRRFRTLARDTDESEYRKALVDVTRAYAVASNGDSAAD
ncbi:DUF5781 family protein [Halomicrobium katesii]|uniref:DUF5781 family protein n=1 Tax=Halomicrobium katesii TaxID=437163 RepID=UPI000381B6DF|nr:DUF5781 family protein [Halomicrobium katesii]